MFSKYRTFSYLALWGSPVPPCVSYRLVVANPFGQSSTLCYLVVGCSQPIGAVQYPVLPIGWL